MSITKTCEVFSLPNVHYADFFNEGIFKLSNHGFQIFFNRGDAT